MNANFLKITMSIIALFLTIGMFQNCGEQKFAEVNNGRDLDAEVAAANAAAADELAAEEAGIAETDAPLRLKPGALVGAAGVCGVVINSANYPICNSVCSVPGEEKVCVTTARILCVSPQPVGSAGELRLSVCM